MKFNPDNIFVIRGYEDDSLDSDDDKVELFKTLQEFVDQKK